MMNDFKVKLLQQFQGCQDSRVLLLGLFFTVYWQTKMNMTDSLTVACLQEQKEQW